MNTHNSVTIKIYQNQHVDLPRFLFAGDSFKIKKRPRTSLHATFL